MARPSQCVVCGCFEMCLAPGARGCAEGHVDLAKEDALANYETADEQQIHRP